MLFNVIRRHSASGSFDEVAAVIAEERNKYESELLAARKRADNLVLREQDRALFAEQMIGIVSHDLRNLLSVVMAASTLLARSGELKSEKSERMLANIVRAAERSRCLIEDLLDFTVARVGQGLAVSRQPVHLHQVAEKVERN